MTIKPWLGATLAAILALGMAGTAGATAGFSGKFYKVAAGSTNYAIADTLAVLAGASLTGTFTSTIIDYNGNDTASIVDFLGIDGASYVGPSGPNDLSDSILVISGNLQIAAVGLTEFDVDADDSERLTVGGRVVTSEDCCVFAYGALAFARAGAIPFQLVYANTQFGGGAAGGYLTLYQNGRVSKASAGTGSAAAALPEPATWAMMLVGLGAIGVAKRSRRRLSVTYA